MLQGESFLWVFLMATAGTVNFWLLSILIADLGRELVDKKQEFYDLWKTNLPSITENVMLTKNSDKSKSIGSF